MRRAFITVMMVLSLLAIPKAAHADVERAWFSSQQYPAPVGSLVPVIATFEGNTINLGARMPVVIVPNEFSAQQSSSCRAQRQFISSNSHVEFTDCYLTQSPSDATSMAVRPVLPNVGQYEAYQVEMTIMLLVTDAAIPGMSYDVTTPDTFAASINVLPREDLHRYAYLYTSPSAARVAPGGKLLIFIQPIYFGDWEVPEYSVTVVIPSGFEISDGPYCGIRSATLPQHECLHDSGTPGNGSETLTVYPGTSSGANANGVYLVVRRTDSQLDGKSIHLSSELRIPSAQQNVKSNPARVDLLTVGKADLRAAKSDTTISAGLVEVRSGYEQNAYGCSTPRLAGTTNLQIKPWGAPTAVAETTIGYGQLGDSTSGRLEQSCFIPYTFNGDFDAPFVFGGSGQAIYVVSTGDCRACALGIVTTATNADVVLVLE